MNFINAVKSSLYGAIAYKLCDQGLSKALVLEELTHGTDPISNIKIRFFGGEPSKAGSQPNYPYANTVGYFYLYKDSEYRYINGNFQGILENRLKYNILGKPLEKWIYLLDNKTNAFILKGERYFKIPREELLKQMTLVRVIGVASLIPNSTLRFRFAGIDPERLKEDTNHPGLAYKTSQNVEPWRLGPIGSCLTGLNFDLFRRVMNDPIKCLTGVSELTAGVSLLFFKSAQMRAKLPFSLVGALLA